MRSQIWWGEGIRIGVVADTFDHKLVGVTYRFMLKLAMGDSSRLQLD